MIRWLKRFAAILLLPFCWGVAKALCLLVAASGQADTVWVAIGAGAICWGVVFWLMPRPTWLYVFGHELTHVLWVYAFGGRVKRFRASAKGGQVVVTKDNFLITLAPYFFPLYAAVTALVFGIGNWLWDWRSAAVWFHLLLGFTYAFHVTLTWEALFHRQPDLTQEGYFFSLVIIWLGNLVILLMGLAWLTGKVGPTTALSWCWIETVDLLGMTLRWLLTWG